MSRCSGGANIGVCMVLPGKKKAKSDMGDVQELHTCFTASRNNTSKRSTRDCVFNSFTIYN